MIRTLRARLTIWYLAILALSLSVFAGLLYVFLSQSLYRHHDEELAEDARRVIDALDLARLNAPDVEAALSPGRNLPPFVMVRKSDGEMIYGSPRLVTKEPDIGRHEVLVHVASQGATSPIFFTLRLDHSGEVRFICTPIARSQHMYLQVGRTLGDVNATLRTLSMASLILVPVVLVLTSFGGLVIARRALAPIRAVADTARSIQATDLRRRIEVHPRDEELAQLVAMLNQLLERLEASFVSLREFVADTSHHLQTPLTVMKGSLEVALASRREPHVYERLLAELADEVNHMSAVLDDLRSLTFADAPVVSASPKSLNLSAAWREAAEIISALGELKGVRVESAIASDLTTRGDEKRLKQVLLNLGENAVKYTPSGGRVLIEAGADGLETTLTVSDSGPGIPQADIPRIFDRFYRSGDPDRVASGSGLGLAIVRRIVEAHGGSVEVTSESGRGSTFIVRLPSHRA